MIQIRRVYDKPDPSDGVRQVKLPRSRRHGEAVLAHRRLVVLSAGGWAKMRVRRRSAWRWRQRFGPPVTVALLPA